MKTKSIIWFVGAMTQAQSRRLLKGLGYPGVDITPLSEVNVPPQVEAEEKKFRSNVKILLFKIIPLFYFEIR